MLDGGIGSVKSTPSNSVKMITTRILRAASLVTSRKQPGRERFSRLAASGNMPFRTVSRERFLEAMMHYCSTEGCSEASVAVVDDRGFCYGHFLSYSYERLEAISAQIHQPQFRNQQTESTGRFLEDCMRSAADIAHAVEAPTNLQRARVMDVLLWASELHGRLRRGPRVPARIPVQIQLETTDGRWEERTETLQVSRHGAHILCRHEANIGDRLTCVRLDTGARADAHVAWIRRRRSGEVEMGIAFLGEVNLWDFESGDAIPVVAPSTTAEPS
jgi:PilZ domain